MPHFVEPRGSSSYHAIRALLECANFEDVPDLVTDAILCDFYVDDGPTGVENAAETQLFKLS